MDKRGKLIVIDGTDGVGKATQTKLLAARLKKERIPVETIEFPQYTSHFGSLIGECLMGKHGDFLTVDPHIASILYAADRFESKAKVEKWLAQGKIVLSDRYVSANQIHQGAKIENAATRKRFLSWLDTMEYKVFKIPRPSTVIYLHVPVALSLELLKARGETDLAERNTRHLAAAQQTAIELSRTYKWKRIECAEHSTVLPREEIHEKIYQCLKRTIRL